MVLPLLKLGTLAVRRISKPLAMKLKQQEGMHPRFRVFIINIAQKNHRLTTTMQRRIYGQATDIAIKAEKRAVLASFTLFGELFVFSVAVAAIIFEVRLKQELEAIRQKHEEITHKIELIKRTYVEIEKLAKWRGLAGFVKFRQANSEPNKASSDSFM